MRFIYLAGLFCLCPFLSVEAQFLGSSLKPFNLTKTPDVTSVSKKGSQNHFTTIKPPLLVKNFLIVIDPGHGGHDVGTQSISKPRYQEKSLNLVTSRFVKDFLLQIGYQVYMTREEDAFISLEKRAQLANESKPSLLSASIITQRPVPKLKELKSISINQKTTKSVHFNLKGWPTLF